MAGDVDLIIQSIGQNPRGDRSRVDVTGYKAAVQLKGLKRQLLDLAPGTTDDISQTIDPLLGELSSAVNGDFTRFGAICLLGFSNGAGQSLAIARMLKRTSAPTPIYIGIADLTLFPYGRNPRVPGIGPLMPSNAPNVSTGVSLTPGAGGVLFRGAHAPKAAENDPPKHGDPGVSARLMENYYTHEGNRVEWHLHRPDRSPGWWWTSSMNGGEVHGEIDADGWKNIRLTTVDHGMSDDGHHDDLCAKGGALTEGMAAIKLREFVMAL